MSNVKSWSTTAASNNSAAPDGFPEGMAPSGVNDAAREVMAAVRTFYNNIEFRDWGHTPVRVSGTQFTISSGSDLSSIYTVNRRISIVDGVPTTLYGTISASSYAASTQTVDVTWDSGSMSGTLTTASLGPNVTNDPIHVEGVKGAAGLAANNTFTGNNTNAGTTTFNQEIVLGSQTEVGTSHTLQQVGGNTIYHIAGGNSFIFKTTTTGTGGDRFKIYNDGGMVGCDGAGNESAGGVKGNGTINATGVYANGIKIVPTTIGTYIATTSGTTHDFTSIPAGTKKIILSFNDISTNGTSTPIIQIGDSGGFEATGYTGMCSSLLTASQTLSSMSTGFMLGNSWSAAATLYGTAILTLVDPATFLWAFSSTTTDAANIMFTAAGGKALSAELTQVRLTTTSGDTFDLGKFNIMYE